MKGKFYSNALFLGELDYANKYQDVKDIGMGGICGDLTHNENYELVRRHIQKWNTTLLYKYTEPNWSDWYSMNFNVQLENGYFVLPEGGYEIYDYIEFPKEPLQVRTAGIHSHIFEDYFILNKPLLNKSWRKISIEEKLAYEQKYQDETTASKKLEFCWNNYQTDFNEAEFSTLAVNETNEKVLFTTKCSQSCFSIVDFNNKDSKGNPTFKFHSRFEEFLTNND